MPDAFAPVAVTARTLTDYRLAFGLDEDGLTRPSYVDIASGASSFAAELRARGGHAISVDPLYRSGPADARDRARHNLTHCERWLNAHSTIIDWDHLGSAHDYRHEGLRAADMFDGDFGTHPEHYVAAALPRIPLPDGAVDVALCANFLFAYADILTVDFHVDAIAEMARLARREVLVHPANHRDGSNIDPFIAEVRDRLAEVGLRCRTFAAPGSWLRHAMTIRITENNRLAVTNRPTKQPRWVNFQKPAEGQLSEIVDTWRHVLNLNAQDEVAGGPFFDELEMGKSSTVRRV